MPMDIIVLTAAGKVEERPAAAAAAADAQIVFGHYHDSFNCPLYGSSARGQRA